MLLGCPQLLQQEQGAAATGSRIRGDRGAAAAAASSGRATAEAAAAAAKAEQEEEKAAAFAPFRDRSAICSFSLRQDLGLPTFYLTCLAPLADLAPGAPPWPSKRIAIAAHPYGFLYSHNQDDSKSIIDTTNSNVNIFVGCNNAHTGPFLRYIAIDSAG